MTPVGIVFIRNVQFSPAECVNSSLREYCHSITSCFFFLHLLALTKWQRLFIPGQNPSYRFLQQEPHFLLLIYRSLKIRFIFYFDDRAHLEKSNSLAQISFKTEDFWRNLIRTFLFTSCHMRLGTQKQSSWTLGAANVIRADVSLREQQVLLRETSQLQVSSDKMPPWVAAEKHNLLLDLTFFIWVFLLIWKERWERPWYVLCELLLRDFWINHATKMHQIFRFNSQMSQTNKGSLFLSVQILKMILIQCFSEKVVAWLQPSLKKTRLPVSAWCCDRNTFLCLLNTDHSSINFLCCSRVLDLHLCVLFNFIALFN